MNREAEGVVQKKPPWRDPVGSERGKIGGDRKETALRRVQCARISLSVRNSHERQ